MDGCTAIKNEFGRKQREVCWGSGGEEKGEM